MTTSTKIIDYTNAITNFNVNNLIVKPFKKNEVNSSLLSNIPTIKSLNS